MNWTNPPGTENQPGQGDRPGQKSYTSPGTLTVNSGGQSPTGAGSGKLPQIKVGKSVVASPGGAESNLEVFTLTLGGETIALVPLKNWTQLDLYKWTVRGKIPGTPPGLEIAPDHVKLAGEIVPTHDAKGCARLEQLFEEWLQLEKGTLAFAHNKAQAPTARPTQHADSTPEAGAPRFKVELDKRGQVHIHCLQGRNTVTSIGLTTAGFNSLFHQGLMRKPRALRIGALHDWVELDGELCSFEKGRNDAARLEQILNERYAPTTAFEAGKEVVVYLNAASPTGFDIQFPVMVAGQPDHHRHHLDDHALERLQDPDHCGLLHKEIIVKFIPPNLVLKKRTTDGGEQYLARVPENTLTLVDDDGRSKTIDLTQALNVMRLSPAELTAIFNHPAINRHSKAAAPAEAPGAAPANVAGACSLVPDQKQLVPPAPSPADARAVTAPKLPEPTETPPEVSAEAQSSSTAPGTPVERKEPETSAPKTGKAISETVPKPGSQPPAQSPEPPKPLPNLWLESVLAQPELRHDWFACLVYSKMAERFGNSSEGKFGPGACWFINLGEMEDIEDPAFKGIFLTEKGGFGFLNAGQMARFYNGVAFIGTQKWALEGIQVNLVATGLDVHERVVFILNDDFRLKFGVPDSTMAEVLQRLAEHGAVLMSRTEALASLEPITVVWTVPMEQANPNEPEALESHAPAPA